MDIFNKGDVRSKRRETILKIAGQLFCSHGFNAVSIDHLAGELGVAKTAIYSHFESKVEIFKACHVASTELLEASVRQVDSPDPMERITAFVHAYVPALLGDQGPGAVLLDLDILPDNMGLEIRERRNRVYRLIQSWMEEAVRKESGQSEEVSAAIFVKVIFGGINILPKWYREEKAWSPEMIADSICRAIRGWVHEPK